MGRRGDRLVLAVLLTCLVCLSLLTCLAASQSAVGGLPEQIRQGKLCIPPRAGIHQVVLNKSCQAEAFIEFANDQQTQHADLLISAAPLKGAAPIQDVAPPFRAAWSIAQSYTHGARARRKTRLNEAA